MRGKGKQASTGPTKRLNQRDMDSSCYRLSRVPQKFSMSKAVKAETAESFAVGYYSANPVDTRPPPEKLEDVESRLGEKVDDDEKFQLLVQKKSLCQMIYGENSPEAVKATTELGGFYNEHGKPDSALRNLLKGQTAAKSTEIEEADSFNLAVELADACLMAAAPSKQDKSKQVATGDAALTPHAETETDNKMNCFRRDLYLARMRSYRTKWVESLGFYEKALNQYHDTHPEDDSNEDEEKDPEEANLNVEAGQVAEHAEENEKAIAMYKRAKEIYEKMGYEEDARHLEDKIGATEEEERQEQEREVEQANEENEDEEEQKLEPMKIEANEEAQADEAK